MKIVAITQRIDYHQSRNEYRDALDHRLNNFLLESGYLPFPIPNSLGFIVDEFLCELKPHAFLLSGGNDIGEFKIRDETERTILKYASINHIPVLGICRGMQMMANFAGVGLREVSNHICSTHKLSGLITGTITCYHKYSIDSCPNDFSTLAISDDGEIEAIKHNILRWESWMWHPERDQFINPSYIQRMKALFL